MRYIGFHRIAPPEGPKMREDRDENGGWDVEDFDSAAGR